MKLKEEAPLTLQKEFKRLKDEYLSIKDENYRLRKVISTLNNLQKNLDNIEPGTDIIALIYNILLSALDAVNSENGSLQLLDEKTSELVFVEVIGPARGKLLNMRIPRNEGIAGWVAGNRKPKLVPDVRVDPLFSPMVDEKIQFQTTSLMCVPLLDGDRVIGTIEVVNRQDLSLFTEQDLDLLCLVGRLASLALVTAEKI